MSDRLLPAWRRGLAPVLTLLLLVALAAVATAYQGGQAVITSPQPFSTLRGVISISGSATHPSFQRYQLYFRSESVPDEWHFMFEETRQVSNALLGTWDTRSVPDGTYALRLRVVRLDGNYDEKEINGLLIANAAPVDTPTPEATPTLAEPAAPTATPTSIFTPTPVTVQQPQISTPTPRPSVTTTVTTTVAGGTPDAGASGSTGATSNDGSLLGGLVNLQGVPESLSLRSMQGSFLTGARIAVGAFLFLGAYVLLRWLIRWLWVRIQG